MGILSLAIPRGRDLEKPYGPSALLTPDGSGSVIMQDAQVVFRNFAGEERQYNREGDRNFCVILDPEIAEDMAKDGWNVKYLKEREAGVPGDPYLQVSVGFKGRPPRIVLISSRGRFDVVQHNNDGSLDLSLVGSLDYADIGRADCIIRPYDWDVNGNQGRKAYLKTLFITLNEDYLEELYGDVPEADDAPEIESGEQSARLDNAGHDVVQGAVV